MNLNIKNDEAHWLAAELARRTGESMTAAVTTALRERLDRLERDSGTTRHRVDAMLAIGRDTAGRLSEPYCSSEHGELLYDDRGLPK